MSCLFAARLSKVAQIAMTGTWPEGIAAIRDRGILFEDAGLKQVVHVEVEQMGRDPEPADLAIVLVKSWQTARVAEHLSSYLKPEGQAISLQNGLGNLELLGSRAFPGTTAEGATLLGPGHVRAGGSGPTHAVAPEWVVQLLQSAGFE